MRRPTVVLVGLVAAALPAAALAGGRGAPISEAGLLGRRDILLFCDFEGTNWARHFSPGTRRAYSGKTTLTEETDPRLVFAGRQSARSLHRKGEHGAGAVTYYLKEGLDEAYMRAYFRLGDDFSLAPANAMKIIWFFGYRPGNEYPSPASVRPTGADKFSCHIVVQRSMRLGFYCYHIDQRGGYGDEPLLNVKGGARLEPGKWYCLEIGVKVNDVGEKNGWLKAWVNGELKGHMKDLRFRTVDDLKIRRASVTLYTGGAGPINTSPKDQYSYYDNYVIAEGYIGPAVFRRPRTKREKPKRVVFKRQERPDPLEAFREPLAPIRAKAKAGEFAEALAECDGLLDDGGGTFDELSAAVLSASKGGGKSGTEALKAYRDGLAAGVRLKKLVIANAAKERPQVYMDLGGLPARAQLVAADEAGASFRMGGTAVSLEWRHISPGRFYGIAAKFAPETPAGHLMLGRYCAAMKLADSAGKELDKAAAEATLRDEVEKARALVE